MKEGIEEFNKLGIPGKNLKDINIRTWNPYLVKNLNLKQIPGILILKFSEVLNVMYLFWKTDVVLLVNGFYYNKNQVNGALPEIFCDRKPKKAIKKKPENITAYLGNYATYVTDYCIKMELCFLNGIFIYVPKNSANRKTVAV